MQSWAARGLQLTGQDRHQMRSVFDLEKKPLLSTGQGGKRLGESGDSFTLEARSLPETGIELLQIRKSGLPHHFGNARGAFGVGIVNRDKLLIRGEVEVQFTGVRPLVPSQLEGRDRVLGCDLGIPPVGNDLHGSSLHQNGGAEGQLQQGNNTSHRSTFKPSFAPSSNGHLKGSDSGARGAFTGCTPAALP